MGKFLSTILFYFAMPLLVFAEDVSSVTSPANFHELVLLILYGIFTPLVSLIIGLAFVTFLWGVYKYITVASTEGKEGARMTIIYGLIGLFVMLSVWGLVKILTETFGVQNVIPQLQSRS
ncbi:MAG: hypothetical protein HYY92_00435 [Parcubacteria group bacterium]|nr:hypothetical protein [Parcubacteria group bacterium]